MATTRHIASQSIILILSTFISACGVPIAQTPTTVAMPPTASTNSTTQPTLAFPPTAASTTAPVPTLLPPTEAPAATALPTVSATQQTPTDLPTQSTATPITRYDLSPPEAPLMLKTPPMDGFHVEWVQRRLLALGYDAGSEDGLYGKQVEQAVRAFQQANGLDADGIVGPNTWEKLNDLAAKGIADANINMISLVDGQYGMIIGGLRDGRWLSGGVVGQTIQQAQTYVEYSTNGPGTLVDGTRAETLGPPCTEDSFHIPNIQNIPTVLIGGPLPPQTRRPTPLLASDAALITKVTTLLGEQGLSQPNVNITAALEVDLDGDGTNEQVVSASSDGAVQENLRPNVEAGDYSFVAVLPASGKPEILIGAFHPQVADALLEEFKLLTAIDLNGDDKLDIVMRGRYYEGSSMGIYSNEGGEYKEVVLWGCGA